MKSWDDLMAKVGLQRIRLGLPESQGENSTRTIIIALSIPVILVAIIAIVMKLQ